MILSADTFRLHVLTQLRFTGIHLSKELNNELGFTGGILLSKELNNEKLNNGQLAIFSCAYASCFEASDKIDMLDAIKKFLKHRTFITVNVTIVNERYNVVVISSETHSKVQTTRVDCVLGESE